MFYKLINDYDQLNDFVNFLEDELPNEQYYISLFSRKKYDTSGILKCDKNCIKRVTARKRDIVSKIEQMEVKLGAYQYDGKPIPQEALAVYITPNPRDLTKAGLILLKGIADKIAQGNDYNPQSLALDKIQITSSRKFYHDVDLDFLEDSKLEDLMLVMSSFINLDACTFIKTRGGYHCLVRYDKIHNEFANKWYQGFAGIKMEPLSVMMNSDNMIPLPGAFQGGFTPYIL